MASPAPSSTYEYSTPGSPSGYSIRSSPSPSPSPSSRTSTSRQSSSPPPSPNFKLVPTYPALTLSSLVVPDAPSLDPDYTFQPQGVYLSNPFLPPIIQSTRESLLQPNADIPALLKSYIALIEPSVEERETLLNAAMADRGFREMIILKYADEKVKMDSETRLRERIEYQPMRDEVATLLSQTEDTYTAGERLEGVLCTQIDTYAFYWSREQPYKVGKEGLESMVLLGEGVLELAEGELKRGVMGTGYVGGMLGLAIEKVLKGLGGVDGEAKGRQKGYLKRAGLLARIKALKDGWNGGLGGGRVDWDRLL